MPATHDGHLHLQRIMALDRLADAGLPFARWLPDFAYGYGLPLFNYYAPLVYLPAAAARALGATYVDSFKLTAGLALLGSAIGMFALARCIFGATAALTAGLVYAYLPYQLVNLYTRGALAEMAAAAWLPIAACCVVRMRTDSRPRWLIAFGLAVCGLVLTHNVTALFALPALAMLAALLWATPAAEAVDRRAYAYRALGGFFVGIGLSAWFWLPAVLERSFVQLSAALDQELFASFFLRNWPPFQTTPAYDYRQPVSQAAGSEIYWPQLGLFQLAIALAGAVALVQARGLARGVLIWGALLAVLGWGLQLALAAPVYDVAPFARFIQFPWRLLTLAGLGSALLAGGLVQAFSGQLLARLAVAGIVIGLSVWSAVARLVPAREFPHDRFVTPEAVLRAELADYGLGSTHGGEYLPVWTGQRSSTSLWKDLRDNHESSGRDRRTAPIQYRVELDDWQPMRARARVTAPQADGLFLHQFFFPGWGARIDGVGAPAGAGGQFGILAVDVPAGTHDVELSFGWTWPRLLGLAASGFSLVALAPALLRLSRERRGLWRRSAMASAGVAAFLWAAVSSYPTVDTGMAASRQTGSVEIGDQLVLLGSSLDASRLQGGDPLKVRLEWMTRLSRPDPHEATVQLVAANGPSHQALWAYAPLMRSWERGELVSTESNLRVPTHFPDGPARVVLRVERRDSGRAAEGSGLTEVVLGEVLVPIARAQQQPASFAVAAGQRVTETLDLLSYELRAEGAAGSLQLRGGDILDASLAWLARETPPQELLAVVHLRGSGAEAASKPHTIGSWFNPPSGWQAGDHFSQQVRIVVPPALLPDAYDVSLRVYGGERSWAGLAPHSNFSPTPRGAPLAELPLGRVFVQR